MAEVALTSADLVVVMGRPLFTFHAVPSLDPRALHGHVVRIDGHRYLVLGVETFALSDVTGTSFGLSVERLQDPIDREGT